MLPNRPFMNRSWGDCERGSRARFADGMHLFHQAVADPRSAALLGCQNRNIDRSDEAERPSGRVEKRELRGEAPLDRSLPENLQFSVDEVIGELWKRSR